MVDRTHQSIGQMSQKIWKAAPKACITTDCKSVFDVATKLNPPQCSEYQNYSGVPSNSTTLSREHLSLRWICSQAMLTDSLTKCMSGDVLREALRTGALQVVSMRAKH